MADTAAPAAQAAAAPSGADIERVQKFTREPVLLEGETASDLVLGTAKGYAAASRARARERHEPPDWKLALFQYLAHRLADESGCTDDGDSILLAHVQLLGVHQMGVILGTGAIGFKLFA